MEKDSSSRIDEADNHQATARAARSRPGADRAARTGAVRGDATAPAPRAAEPPDAHRDPATGVRVPPCRARVLRCHAKRKWCGQPLLAVLGREFADLSRPKNLAGILDHGLLRLNDVPVTASRASQVVLRDGDRISRLVHWHEAPVIVPPRLGVRRMRLPASVVADYGLAEDCAVYICDKPASVPVHPAGPYLANALTVMVEAQEGPLPTSLVPVHRTDRVTSGLVLLASDPATARVFHRSLAAADRVKKLYLAQVPGRFCRGAGEPVADARMEFEYSWDGTNELVEVNAPIETVDPANGLRAVTDQGKPARSLFRLEAYDADSDTSLISCFPVTGRNHQLRVHLSRLGFPILGDIQYGGRPLESDLKTSVLSSMENACAPADDGLLEHAYSTADLEAARASCSCCREGADGILGSFTRAQLLLGGHVIQLHAWRYQVDAIGGQNCNEVIAALDYSVPLPSWAQALEVSNVSWLRRSELCKGTMSRQ